ncbi:septum formation protein Maf [PVC group bacterium (ex Bugula neritina AB1)]|nr:septum formation protein Maf [PVC group bacterium (ex Bugula neritina AB1)]
MLNKTPSLILASNSPRRANILDLCSLPFSVVPSNVEEWETETANPFDLTETNAKNKAKAVALSNKTDIVIAADTVVYSQQKVLNKPQDFKHAMAMFESYCGNDVSVFTGLAVCYGDQIKTGVDETIISMRPFEKEKYKKIVQRLFSLDKAGGFTIEGMGAILFDNIKGSFYNVLGLPVHLLENLISSLGFDIWTFSEKN